MQYTLRLIYTITTLLTLFAVSISSASALEPVFSAGGKAIRGYDAVTYFTQSEAVRGTEEFAYVYKDANWYFSSTENRDQFAANPERYAPQYGGYCAYAMSFGKVASTDPEAWTVVAGKLYLNFSKPTRRTWLKDTSSNIRKADKHWVRLLGN